MRSGVTLSEALVGLGLASMVILAAVALAISAIQSNQKAADLQGAGVWAGQQMEEFVYGLPRFNQPFWTATSFASPYRTENLTLGNTTYRSDIFVNDLSAQGPGLRLITVNVSWGSGSRTRVGSGLQVTSLSRIVYAH